MTISQTSLTADPSGRAVLKLTSSNYVKAQQLGVSVRDSAGTALDYGGFVTNVNVGPDGYIHVSDARVSPLPNGTYTVYGSYKFGDVWTDLPSQQLVVGSPPPPPPPPPGDDPYTPASVVAGKTKVFDEQFATISATRWSNAHTSSYPGVTNPGDNKLDYLNPASSAIVGGVLVQTATKRADGKWNTGLLTTEYSSENFQMRTGDYIQGRFKFSGQLGEWPALWTWGSGTNGADNVPGHGELDVFEYHSDNAHLLELTNHAGSGANYLTNSAVTPGTWFTFGVYVTATKLYWYLNGVLVYSGGSMPAAWKANLILNQSVVAGQYHPAPNHSNPMPFSTDYLTVWR